MLFSRCDNINWVWHPWLDLTIVLESLVQSGLLALKGMDRDQDWSALFPRPQKTGLDQKRPLTAVFCSLLTGPGLHQLQLVKDQFSVN